MGGMNAELMVASDGWRNCRINGAQRWVGGMQNLPWRGIGGENPEFAVAMVTSDVGNG